MYNSVDSIIVGQLVGKRGIGGGRHKQSINDTCNFVCERYVYRGFYFDGNPVRRKENGCFKAADQHDDDRRNCVLHCGHVVLHSFARPLLLLIRVQEEVLPLAVSYLRIVFLGFIFTFIYNFFACTLRALGDSTTPLYFLVASSVLNIIGDLFFVAVLRWGKDGLCGRNGRQRGGVLYALHHLH